MIEALVTVAVVPLWLASTSGFLALVAAWGLAAAVAWTLR